TPTNSSLTIARISVQKFSASLIRTNVIRIINSEFARSIFFKRYPVKRLTINKQILQDELNVELIGAIDEDADFKELTGLEQKQISFDFDKISMINSCGIREWIKFIEMIPSRSNIVYKNCPQIIIEQINMVHGFFRQGATIES